MTRLSYPLLKRARRVSAQVEHFLGQTILDLQLVDTDLQQGFKGTAHHTCLHYQESAHSFSSSLIMAGVKRASDGHASAAKRARLSNQEQDMVPKDRLEAMAKDDLVAHILKLQAQILSTSQASPSPPATPGLTEEEIHRKASKALDMMEKGIKSQMKWKPSCKTGAARFSYSGVVASTQVFLKMFRLGADWKKKQLKFAPADFQHTTGAHISASIRYGYLNITGKNVTVRWDPDELTFTVTGSYGL